jgi:hypothetical protein
VNPCESLSSRQRSLSTNRRGIAGLDRVPLVSACLLSHQHPMSSASGTNSAPLARLKFVKGYVDITIACRSVIACDDTMVDGTRSPLRRLSMTPAEIAATRGDSHRPALDRGVFRSNQTLNKHKLLGFLLPGLIFIVLASLPGPFAQAEGEKEQTKAPLEEADIRESRNRTRPKPGL